MENIVPGAAVSIAPHVIRITAPNPGVMTGPGTNSYVIGERELAVIDPGPAIESHVAALVEAVGPHLKWILCTHTHLDHSPAAGALKRATGAQIAGFACPQDGRQDADFAPDRALADGDTVSIEGATFRAIHTPGHVCNHLCYLLEEQKLLFTGDHVMQGSTVVITPPNGDMQHYFDSLDKLLHLDLEALAPGHGHVITTPHDEVKRLVAHRLKREQKVVDALARKSPGTLDDLVPLAYDDVSPRLHPVARRSLHAHLIKLVADGRARASGDAWSIVDP
jgi:glyoxylase-like metal-dependent hydrolase (beta-lactamase superfamily II)